MRVLVFAEAPAEQLRGAVGDDLVGVHVKADTRACLEDVNHKVLVPLAVLDFLGGGDDGIGGLWVEQAEFAVGFGGGFLHHGNGANERNVRAQAADGIVLDRTRCLDAVVHVGRDVFKAQGIFLGASGRLGHERCLQQRDDSGGGKGAPGRRTPSNGDITHTW